MFGLSRVAARLRRPPVPGARPIRTSEAVDLIEARGLRTVRDAWHYSWEIERFFPFMWALERDDILYVFSPEPYHKWAPAPLFSNDPSIDRIISNANPDRAAFWFLRLTTFDDFLSRRSSLSRRPNAHFPTRQTYWKIAEKLDCRLERWPLFGNEHFFVAHYDPWKVPKFKFSGAECIKVTLRANRRVPRDWFQVYSLVGNADRRCKALLLTVQNERTCWASSVASEKDHGVLCMTEAIRDLCERGFTSFEGGAVGKYDYMTKVFLDPLPIGSATKVLNPVASRP